MQRHKTEHLRGALTRVREVRAEYVAVRERAAGLQIASTLGVLLERSRLLLDACDAELRDPLQPDRYYVGPQSHECSVMWEEVLTGEDGRQVRVRHREPMSEILDRMREHGMTPVRVEVRHHDIRRMVLETQADVRASLEHVEKLIRDSVELTSRTDAAAKLSVIEEDAAREELAGIFRECGLSEVAFAGFWERLQALSARDAAVAAELGSDEE